MKKILLILFAVILCLCPGLSRAEEEESEFPKRNMIVYYDVADGILKSQTSDETVEAGREEFEDTIRKAYKNRFKIIDVRQAPKKPDGTYDKKKIFNLGIGQHAYIFTMQVVGFGTMDETLETVKGNILFRNAPTAKLQFTEYFADETTYVLWNNPYPIAEYGAKIRLFFGQPQIDDSPRKVVKNAVKMYLEDLGKFNKNNERYKFSNPELYDGIVGIFTGDTDVIRKTAVYMNPQWANAIIAKAGKEKKADGFM